ncbi:MAG: Lrp/AsnC family transcriptional regulator [Novosphingobium sp.]|nr:Lrp/AsnC family transcriptional regulator [Novosphingobium sp.]
MDRTDLKLLALLQEDAAMSHADLGERVGLSPSQCSRRIQRLSNDGVIRRQVALLDEALLGFNVEAFIMVALTSYASEAVVAFHARMIANSAIVECCALTGDSDYLLRVVTLDLPALSLLINEVLLGHGDVASVRSSIVLNRIKRTTALPLRTAKES